MNDRYAEVNYDESNGTWAVVLHRTSEAGPIAEQEFASLNNADVTRYINAWCKNGVVLF